MVVNTVIVSQFVSTDNTSRREYLVLWSCDKNGAVIGCDLYQIGGVLRLSSIHDKRQASRCKHQITNGHIFDLNVTPACCNQRASNKAAMTEFIM